MDMTVLTADGALVDASIDYSRTLVFAGTPSSLCKELDLNPKQVTPGIHQIIDVDFLKDIRGEEYGIIEAANFVLLHSKNPEVLRRFFDQYSTKNGEEAYFRGETAFVTQSQARFEEYVNQLTQQCITIQNGLTNVQRGLELIMKNS